MLEKIDMSEIEKYSKDYLPDRLSDVYKRQAYILHAVFKLEAFHGDFTR